MWKPRCYRPLPDVIYNREPAPTFGYYELVIRKKKKLGMMNRARLRSAAFDFSLSSPPNVGVFFPERPLPLFDRRVIDGIVEFDIIRET